MSGDIVDAIDRALTDYGTSMDAMRWVPDVPEDEPQPVVRPFCYERLMYGIYPRRAEVFREHRDGERRT